LSIRPYLNVKKIVTTNIKVFATFEMTQGTRPMAKAEDLLSRDDIGKYLLINARLNPDPKFII
jgi:hypothetical protein